MTKAPVVVCSVVQKIPTNLHMSACLALNSTVGPICVQVSTDSAKNSCDFLHDANEKNCLGF